MTNEPPQRERETRPEVLAQRDRLARKLVACFERDGYHTMAAIVGMSMEFVRDIKVQPRPPAPRA